ncbi:MAG: hypothetical protein J5511_03155 [Bacilli bacterium]|nr:hypothetical protein [Bacilli bacterium]
MKTLKTLIAIGLSIGGLSSAVVLGAVNVNHNEINVANAADTLTDGCYLVGSGSINGTTLNWASGIFLANKMEENPDNSDEMMLKGILFDTSGTVKLQMIQYTANTSYVAWNYNCASVSEADEITDSNYLDVWDEGNNAGVYIPADQVRVFDLYVNKTTKNYHFAQSTLTARIGSVSDESVINPSYDGEFMFTVENVVPQTAITLETCKGAQLSISPNSGANNNYYDDNGEMKVIIGGEISLYVNRWTLVTWADGYGNNANNFATGFLSNTISSGICADPSTTTIDDIQTWTYYSNWHYNLTASQKAAFQYYVNNAPISSDSSDYTSVFEEAAARYVWLKEKYPSLFNYTDVVITRNSRFIIPIVSTNNSVPIVLTGTITGLMFSACLILFLKKKKEQ